MLSCLLAGLCGCFTLPLVEMVVLDLFAADFAPLVQLPFANATLEALLLRSCPIAAALVACGADLSRWRSLGCPGSVDAL